jgi:hypothetical protein
MTRESEVVQPQTWQRRISNPRQGTEFSAAAKKAQLYVVYLHTSTPLEFSQYCAVQCLSEICQCEGDCVPQSVEILAPSGRISWVFDTGCWAWHASCTSRRALDAIAGLQRLGLLGPEVSSIAKLYGSISQDRRLNIDFPFHLQQVGQGAPDQDSSIVRQPSSIGYALAATSPNTSRPS